MMQQSKTVSGPSGDEFSTSSVKTGGVVRPRSLKKLHRVVAVIEEKCSVARERQRVSQDTTWEESKGVVLVESYRAFWMRTEAQVSAPVKCSGCGRPRHLRRNCPRKAESQRNGRHGWRILPRRGFVSGLSPAIVACLQSGLGEPFLQNLFDEESKVPTPSGVSMSSIVEDFPTLYSSTLGTAMSTPYETEFSDPTTVRSLPYRCGPPKLANFRKMVDELLELRVVRPSEPPYEGTTFLVPKAGGITVWW